MRLGGAAPGQCQTGWLKTSMVVDTSTLTPDNPDAVVPDSTAPARPPTPSISTGTTGRYTVTLAGIDSGTAISSSAGANAVTAASKIDGRAD